MDMINVGYIGMQVYEKISGAAGIRTRVQTKPQRAFYMLSLYLGLSALGRYRDNLARYLSSVSRMPVEESRNPYLNLLKEACCVSGIKHTS